MEQGNMLVNARSQIAEIAAARMLPTVYGYREHVEAGGLISYGVDLNWCIHRMAYFVDKILKGAKPAELPLEFPTNLQLMINLKTAKALKLNIPPAAPRPRRRGDRITFLFVALYMQRHESLTLKQGGHDASDNSRNYQSARFSHHEFARGRSSDASCTSTCHKWRPRNEGRRSRL